MTQHTEQVRVHKVKMEAELWGKEVNYIYVANGVLKIRYNNGNIKYEQTRNTGNGIKKDKIWWEYSEKTNEGLIGDFRRHLADFNWKRRGEEE